MNERALRFAQHHRDPLLGLDEYEEQNDYHLADKSHRYKKLDDESKDVYHRCSISWSITYRKFEHAFLNYSSGNSMEDVDTLVHVALNELKRHKSQYAHDNFLFWEPDSFQFILWCLSFAVLSGQVKYLTTIARLYGTRQDAPGEACMSAIFRCLGVNGIPGDEDELLVFPKTYQYFYNAIKTGPLAPSKKERQVSLKGYLRGWYKGMKDCYWYDRHKRPAANFFGYWAVETALVTLLFDLDDSDYRHLPYYPKDWVDYARSQGFDKLLKSENLPNIQIAFPDIPCPVTGKWQDNLSADVISLTVGDIMPGPKADENETARFWVFQVS